MRLEREITMEVAPPVRLHPNLAQVYRRQVERLQDTLNSMQRLQVELIDALGGDKAHGGTLKMAPPLPPPEEAEAP